MGHPREDMNRTDLKSELCSLVLGFGESGELVMFFKRVLAECMDAAVVSPSLRLP